MASPAFGELPAAERRALAGALVQVSDAAMALLREEAESAAQLRGTNSGRPPTSLALGAGQQFSGVATDKIAGTTRQILNAVSFPRFVTELINGVFKAILDSNRQQMDSFVELLKNVAATTEGFADTNLGPSRARQWLIERYPGSFELDTSDSSNGADDTTDSGAPGDTPVRLRDGASMPSEAAMRTDLGLGPDESVPSGDPESSLVPLVRNTLARQRQKMLGTMVMLGLQRIVIESGRLNAAMRFHVDARSAAASDSGSTFDLQNRVDVSGSFGFGPWGVDAKMSNTIGYVTTERDQTTEEMNTSVDLNSSVELLFKTDYLPLERLAGPGQVDRIKANTLNPDAEQAAADQQRLQRLAAAYQSEASRRAALDKALQPATSPISPASSPSPARTSVPAPLGGSRSAAPKSAPAAPAT